MNPVDHLLEQVDALAAELKLLRAVASAARDLLLAWPRENQECVIPAHLPQRLAEALLDIGQGVDGPISGGRARRA